MPLPPGQRLNGYEILSLVGAGGMGEVYRARDTRLTREVALKILPPEMAGNAAAFARFEREAQAVAALSHPNILAVHDFGRTDAHSYVVFELLLGATLRERLEAGPLPVRKAVDYARQAADGLAAAHARGIIHRDIKPDNLFVTGDGRVKILDFGLAQTAAPGAGHASTSAHTLAPITDPGTVMGTMGYMAPEQIRGQAVDHRADLFALGATLYEMCTGRRAFKAATPADTMSAVLTSDPPELTVPGQAPPPALDRIVRRCLEKQPAERFQSARDLSFALDALSSLSGPGAGSGAGPMAAAPPPVPRRGWLLPAAVAAGLALVTGLGLGRVLWPRPAQVSAPVVTPALRAEFGSTLTTGTSVLVAISPDGRRLVYSDVSRSTGSRELVLRELATGATTSLPDSSDAILADWSPRSDAVLYVTGPELRLYRVGERTSRLVTGLREGFRGLAWLRDDTLIACHIGSEMVQRLSLDGGPPVVLMRRSDGDSGTNYQLPRRIAGRTDHVLALTGGRPVDERQMVVIRLADGHVTPLGAGLAIGAVASGYLLQPLPNGLFATPFDVERLALTGDPIRVVDPIVWDPPTGLSSLSASDTGVLAFEPTVDRLSQFEWLSETGRSLGLVGPPDYYGAFSLSPDGARIVARLIPSQRTPLGNLRLIDIARNLASPIATPDGLVSDPIWTSDGSRIVYRLADALMRQSPFSDTAETLRKGSSLYPDAMSRDGRSLLVGRPEPAGGYGLFAVASDGSGELQPVSTDGPASDEGAFAPDGRLVAYHATRTGRAEIYLSRFPPTGERWQVSPAGGVQPRFSADGRALYYLDLAGNLVRVAVQAANPERIGRPEVLFNLGVDQPSTTLEQYAVHGNRFLALRPREDAAHQTVAVVSNWTSLLPPPAPAAK